MSNGSGGFTARRRLGGRPGILMLVLLLGLAGLILHTPGVVPNVDSKVQKNAPSLRRSPDFFASLPLTFELNEGQTDPRVKFLARGPGYTLFLTEDEAVVALRSRKTEVRSLEAGSRQLAVVSGQLKTDRDSKLETRKSAAHSIFSTPQALLSNRQSRAPSPDPRESDVVRMKLVGSSRAAKVVALDELPGKSNYFLGNDPGKWRTNVPTFAKAKYEGVYPGIDLVYYGKQRQLEYDFVVSPGADPRVIALQVVTGDSGFRNRNSKFETRNASHQDRESTTRNPKPKIRIASNGDLIVMAEGGEVRFHKPLVYQPAKGRPWSPAGGRPQRAANNGARTTDSLNPKSNIQNAKLLPARYVLTADNRIRFEIPRYDRARPLVIDPVLSYSTYLGGTGGDVAYGIAVDGSGNAYVTGSTGSVNFPVKSAEQTAGGGGGDAFVTKFTAAGTALIYSTYLGGAGSDVGNAIVVDSTGSVYLAGSTSSSDFPITTGAVQANNAGNGDAFIAKLNATGTALGYSTYLGGTGMDVAQAIAVDSSGNAFVTGSTQSSDFPTLNPLQIGNDGCTLVSGSLSCSADVFVSKVNASGTGLVYSTYLGGAGGDFARGIAVDGSGNAYIAGYTGSTNFPTQNALQSTNAGGVDAFVAELNAAGAALVYSTYLGGSGQDRAFAIALDSAGSVYVTGDTQSANFPTTSTAFQVTNGGQGDVFVTKVSPGGSSIAYSTFLGGTGTDQGSAVALDSSLDAYVTGFTQSSDFPTVDPLQTILGLSGASTCPSSPCPDAFVSKLGPSGAPVYSTFLGGNGADMGQAVAVDSTGAAYVAGSTTSPNFPVIAGASQASFAGSTASSNAFVAKLDAQDAPGVALTPQQINFGNQALNSTSNPQSVVLVNAGSAALSISSITTSGDFAQTNDCGSGVPAGGGSCTIQITFTPTTTGSRTDEISINTNAAGSPQVITVTGTGVLAGGQLSVSPTSLAFAPEPVGTTSAAQDVRVTNSGTTAVTVTSITASSEFTQTNTCGTLPAVLNVGASCTISVTFTPSGSGNRSGTVTINDDAANNPQTVSLTGTGNPVFTVSGTPRSNVVVVGTASTTFSVSASAPSSFTSSINLACSSASGATCTFDPTSITSGQTSTLTVSGITATSPNPLNITVTGTSGSQTASVSLSVFFSDFKVAAAPSLNSVTAGGSTTYTTTVTPMNGFNQVVLLSCAGLPANTTCTWSPPGMTLDGLNAATATVSVNTTASTSSAGGWRPPGGNLPGGANRERGMRFLFIAVFTLLVILIAAGRNRRRTGRARIPLRASLVVLALLAAFLAIQLGCTNYYYNPISPANPNGTPAGTYTITFVGTLGNNSTIRRTTTVNMTVSP